MTKKMWLAIALVFLAACSSAPKRDLNDPANSLIFGYVDMDDAPTSIAYASIQQVAPANEQGYWSLGVRKGLFYSGYLPPGSYQLAKFGGSGFFAGEHVYNFPRQGNQTALRIEKPGIYFLGSYKYKTEKSGVFEAGKFSMQKVDRPTEAELLKRILDQSDIKDSSWRDKIQARLRQLK